MIGQNPADEEADLLAAEFALGLLDPDETAAATSRERSDPTFAAAVARWRGYRADLVLRDAEPDREPGSAVWGAIVAGIERAEDRPSVSPDAARRLLRRWQVLSAGLAALAATFLAMVLARPATVPPPPLPTPQLVALLGPNAAPAFGAATYEPNTHRLTIRLRHLDLRDRVPQLWLIGADGQPRSLGVVGNVEDWSRVAPDDMPTRFARGVSLAVSLEPAGGSPLPHPTGPVILSGKLS